LRVQATQVGPTGALSAAGKTPADKGTLTWNQNSQNPLSCDGYQANDTNSYQFYLGFSTLGNILYSVTYTVVQPTTTPVQFCLGTRHLRFTTRSGAPARPVILPNGKSGFVGLLPDCRPAQIGQLVACVVSRAPSGPNTILKAQVPAIGGDPWGRS
jgi:hypothetical protein